MRNLDNNCRKEMISVQQRATFRTIRSNRMVSEHLLKLGRVITYDRPFDPEKEENLREKKATKCGYSETSSKITKKTMETGDHSDINYFCPKCLSGYKYVLEYIPG